MIRDIAPRRIAARLTRQQLAQLADTTESCIWSIEVGGLQPRAETAERIERVLQDAQRRAAPGPAHRR